MRLRRVVGNRLNHPLRPALANVIDGGVHGDSVQPGVEPLREVEAPQDLPEPEENSLRDILGILQVACDLKGRSHDALAFFEDQVLERPALATRGGPDQIGQVLVVPHPRLSASGSLGPAPGTGGRSLRVG